MKSKEIETLVWYNDLVKFLGNETQQDTIFEAMYVTEGSALGVRN